MSEPENGGIVVDPRPPAGVRIDEECLAAFDRFDPVRGAESVRELWARRDRRELSWGWWTDPDGAAGGALAWESIPRTGRRVLLWFLDERHRSRDALAAMLGAFEEFSPLDGPTFYLPDALPGVALEDESAVLEPSGMVHLDRERVRFPKDAELPAAPLGPSWTLRPPGPEDAPPLLELLGRAYADYPGQLQWTHVDLERDLRDYLEHLSDRRPTLLPEGTFVVLVQGRIRGNVIARRDAAGPYIDSLSVDPRWQGRGLGRALMVRALEGLRSAGPAEDVRLNYLRQNPRAGALYRSLGFRSEALPWDLRSGYWVRRKTLQVVIDRPGNAKFR